MCKLHVGANLEFSTTKAVQSTNRVFLVAFSFLVIKCFRFRNQIEISKTKAHSLECW